MCAAEPQKVGDGVANPGDCAFLQVPGVPVRGSQDRLQFLAVTTGGVEDGLLVAHLFALDSEREAIEGMEAARP